MSSKAPVFDLIFVRHGYSCANKIHKTRPGVHWTYTDPELTKSGVERSESLCSSLMKEIKKIWPNESYNIGSSQMIRAQETAYYMLAKNTGKKINILPHIGEPHYTKDNYSFPLEKQREIIRDRNPDILKFIGKDAREKQTLSAKSNWDLFMKWACDHLDFFTKGKDGHYRCVIFTHSIFLKKNFKLKEKINNNNGVYTIINTAESIIPKSDYKLLLLNNANFVDSCPDDCRRSICEKSNTTRRKSTRSNKNCRTCQTLRRIKRSRKLIGFPKTNDPDTYIKRLLNQTS